MTNRNKLAHWTVTQHCLVTETNCSLKKPVLGNFTVPSPYSYSENSLSVLHISAIQVTTRNATQTSLRQCFVLCAAVDLDFIHPF